MPTFRERDGLLTAVARVEFATEKELQSLVERNLEATYGSRFIASEFSTGVVHGGRIDTLGLSEDGNPVIIEYKKVESASLINQALFYLDWLKDHHGDFELAAKKTLGDVDVNWGRIRVICLAPGYDNYSVHAVKHMGADIELWQYRRFADGYFELEEVYRKSGSKPTRSTFEIEPQVEAPKPEYSIDDHLAKGSTESVQLFEQLRAGILDIDPSIAEVPQKLYIAYKLARNLVCVEIQKKKLIATINRKAFESMPPILRDVTNLGHWGTGDVEAHISSPEHVNQVLAEIKTAYLEAGGD